MKSGNIWISTDEGLARYNRNSNNFTTFKPSTANTELANQTVQLYEDSKNNLWIGTSEGLSKYHEKNDSFIRYDNPFTKKSKDKMM